MASTVNPILKPFLSLFPDNNRIERIYLLARGDFKKRYYDSALGLFWALLNPLLRLAVYTLAFTFLRTNREDNFVLYLFSGLIMWMFFTELAGKGTNIIKQKKYLFESIQFNWFDVFIAAGLSTFFGLLFNFLAYIIMSVFYGVYPGIYALWFPVLIVNLFLVTLGFSLIMASISVYFKDITHLWSIIVLAGFWTAPIFFPLEGIKATAPFLLYLHPVTGIIVNVRNILMYDIPLDMVFFIWNWVYAFIVLGIGILLFKFSSLKAIEKL